MRKVIRINYILIAVIFAAIAALGVFICTLFEESLSTSALSHGSGTYDDPYKIYSSTEFTNLQELSGSDYSKDYTEGKYFSLENDITVYSISSTLENAFYGIFDGNDHTVTVISGNGLFYRLGAGAIVENVVVEINLSIYKFKSAYGLANTVAAGAVVKNCTVRGGADLSIPDLRGEAGGATVSCAGFCLTNNGIIENSTFEGTVSVTGYEYASAAILFSGFTISGGGEVNSCTVNAQVDIRINVSKAFYFYGFSRLNRAVDCTFNGNVVFRKNPSHSSLGIATTIYALGFYVENCTFNGDLTFDFTEVNKARYNVIRLANEGTYVHNGNIYEIFN